MGKNSIWSSTEPAGECRLETQPKLLPQLVVEQVTSFDGLLAETEDLIWQRKTVEEISLTLLSKGLVICGGENAQNVARSLAFASLGWHTMLFQPAVGNCPLQQFAIADVLDGHTGQAFMALKQDHSRISRPLPDFILGFGVMLPKENLCFSADKADTEAFENTVLVGPESLNAALLQSLAQVRIQWVDVIAPHLEFDKITNTLFLYRFPSSCSQYLDQNDQIMLHCLAANGDDPPQWASENEISDFMREILLSYRLLFGQDRKSRQAFHSSKPFNDLLKASRDSYLSELCASKTAALPNGCKELQNYRLTRDFPILRSRIATLQQCLSAARPRSWKQI